MEQYTELSLSIQKRNADLNVKFTKFYTKHIETEFAHATKQENADFPFEFRVPVHDEDFNNKGVSIIREYVESFGYRSLTINKSIDGHIYINVQQNGTKQTRHSISSKDFGGHNRFL